MHSDVICCVIYISKKLHCHFKRHLQYNQELLGQKFPFLGLFKATVWITRFDSQLAISDNLKQTCGQQVIANHANTSLYRLVDHNKVGCKMPTDEMRVFSRVQYLTPEVFAPK